MSINQIFYKCVCEWFETPRKGDIRRHIQRYGCIDEEDIDILCLTRKNRDLSYLNEEDKLKLWREEDKQRKEKSMNYGKLKVTYLEI